MSHKIIHVTDWMPTFLSMAGYPREELEALGLDGVDQSRVLMEDDEVVRTDFVYNIDQVRRRRRTKSPI